MTQARTFAASAARHLISRLPLPIVAPMDLQRGATTPAAKCLAFRRIAVVGRAAADATKLIDHLQDCGARVRVALEPEPSDSLIAVLSERAGYDDLLLLHGMVAPWLQHISDCGRILIVSRTSSPLVTAAIHAFVRSLAREVGKRGITVNAVAGDDLNTASPIVAFLASDRSSYITAQTLVLAPGPAPFIATPNPQLAVVTGSAQGIGAAIAKALGAAGYRVAVLDLPSQSDRALEVCSALGGEPAGMAFIPCDLRDEASIDKALEQARPLSPLGTIDVLVNNAGITRDRTLLKMTPEEWHAVLTVDLWAVMQATRKALPRLGPAARVIQVSSTVGLSGNFGQTNYATAKGGVIGFTLQAGKEVESKGISMVGVAPGLIDTEISQAMPPMHREIAKQMTCLAQAGTVQDVALAVEFLARREAWPLRTQLLRVDGGMFFGP